MRSSFAYSLCAMVVCSFGHVGSSIDTPNTVGLAQDTNPHNVTNSRPISPDTLPTNEAPQMSSKPGGGDTPAANEDTDTSDISSNNIIIMVCIVVGSVFTFICIILAVVCMKAGGRRDRGGDDNRSISETLTRRPPPGQPPPGGGAITGPERVGRIYFTGHVDHLTTQQVDEMSSTSTSSASPTPVRLLPLLIAFIAILLTSRNMQHRGNFGLPNTETFSLLRLNAEKQRVWTDVAAEQERVKSGGLSDLTHPLIVKNLCKSFKGMSKLTPAVNNITFAVAKAETFGLLGLNGAGKTTTFNMLTRFEKPNSGSAAILGMDMLSHNSKRFKNASYCPQENRLFSKLTIERHLMMVAALRGVPHDVTNELLKRLIREVGLDSQKGKRAGTLSGGNQRNLNLAMALIDYRPVIFLDEPTTGMDPGAKRQAWDCIKHATARGCSVVLTSHSMEECEALCHRLVIMATGSFLCIGSVQYLKHKFGDKYIFKIKLQEQAASWDQLNQVRKFIEADLPTAILMEEHGAVLAYEIPRSQTLKLSHLSQVMLTCRRTFPVEDISVRQSPLEEIFITMGKNQDEGKVAATPNQTKMAPTAPILPTPAAANKAASGPDPKPVSPKPLKTPGSSGGSGSDADENKKEKDVV